jgi:hypothetical protein
VKFGSEQLAEQYEKKQIAVDKFVNDAVAVRSQFEIMVSLVFIFISPPCHR